MKYLSLFSGIEAATQAWKPLGWEPVAFSEIEPFPCAVLKHHYPSIPNLGDVTKITEEQIKHLGPIDLVIFGSPCQDLSIAGKRKGLNGERSGLFATAVNIIKWCRKHNRTRFALWENVPGAFSSNEGKDFAEVIRLLSGARISFKKWSNSGVAIGKQSLLEWRVLDAQYYGVPQRRRRILALADFGDWTHRQPILFEQKSLPRHIEKSRKKTKNTPPIAGTLTANGGGTERVDGQCNETDFLIPTWPADVAPTLDAHFGDKMGLDNQHINSGGGCSFIAKTLTTKTRLDAETETLITTGGVFDQPISIVGNIIGRQHHAGGNGNGYDESGIMYTLTATDRHAVTYSPKNPHWGALSVRRLTPIECERLQGFPDNFTQIPLGKKTAEQCADSPRYKALGNSMAIPVIKWIGQRIDVVMEAEVNEVRG